MSRTYFVLLTILGLFYNALVAQQCPTSELVLSRQSQIDSFPILFPDCTQLTHGLKIEETAKGQIIDLSALVQLVASESYLEINNNPSLMTLSGLDGMSKIGGRLVIRSNASLLEFRALQNLGEVGESILISDNAMLSDIKPLVGLQELPGDLTISGNGRLENLAGLDSLVKIGGNLLINNNDVLRGLSGLNGLREVTKNLHISDCPELKELNGLDSLQRVEGDLIIDNNSSLSSLRGLNQLQSIGGFLHLINCAELTDLQGLAGLESIEGLLQIYNNPSLGSLTGLDAIDHESIKDLAIIDCPKLNVCDVASICEYLQGGVSKHSIFQNEQGCNDQGEILSGCPKGGPTVSPGRRNYLFYPNPTFGQVRFAGDIGEATLVIRDVRGRLIHTQLFDNTFFDLSLMAPGVYSITLKGETEVIVQPVVKL